MRLAFVKTYAIFLFTCIVLFSQAQSTRSWLAFNITPSITKSTGHYAMNEFYADYWIKPTVHCGLEWGKMISERIDISIGTKFTQFGFNEKGSTFPSEEIKDYTESFRFLTIPVTLSYHAKRFYFGAGLNISYFLNRSQTIDNQKRMFNTPKTYSINGNLDYWFTGVQALIGKQWTLKSHSIIKTEFYSMFTGPHYFTPGFKSYGIRASYSPSLLIVKN
ncbi:MAG: outer membrane beta-barrel protein [Bacteroidia bacterium]